MWCHESRAGDIKELSGIEEREIWVDYRKNSIGSREREIMGQ